jgi:hypothetical protein
VILSLLRRLGRVRVRWPLPDAIAPASASVSAYRNRTASAYAPPSCPKRVALALCSSPRSKLQEEGAQTTLRLAPYSEMASKMGMERSVMQASARCPGVQSLLVREGRSCLPFGAKLLPLHARFNEPFIAAFAPKAIRGSSLPVLAWLHHAAGLLPRSNRWDCEPGFHRLAQKVIWERLTCVPHLSCDAAVAAAWSRRALFLIARIF